MHAEKREGWEAKSHAADYVIALYSKLWNRTQTVKNRVSQWVHRYGFTRIFGGSTSSITTLIDQFDCEFSLPLIEVQSSSIQFRIFCTLLTVMLIKIFRFGWIHDLTSKIRSNNTLRSLSIWFVYGSIPCCTKRLRNRLHVISPPTPSHFSACIIEKLVVAWWWG